MFRLGATDGPDEILFTGPLTAVTISPNGNLFVLDQQTAEIRVFGGDGRFLRKFGRFGPGPGEMSAPGSLAWDQQGFIWVPESFNGRYTVFDSLGVYVKTVPRAMHSTPRFLFPVRFQESGDLLDWAPQGRRISPVLVDTSGEGVDTFPPIHYSPTPSWLTGIPSAMLGDAMREAVRNFLPRLVWALAPDGTIWLSRSGEYRLVQIRPDGDTVRVIEAHHREPVLSAAERDLIDGALHEKTGAASASDFKKTVVHAIHPLDDGHLLVQIAGEMKAQTPILDVFDPDGRFLGTIDLGFPLQTNALHAFKGDTLAVVTLGELDVPYVVKAVIRRPQG